ncbi:hypothetical protein LCGC14_2648500 [marine sediment metagenome]|uniref:Nuclease associated modular domain-containing protein n=1 Tax=marine sediment metagenome TaxID=412755 RepID=A0A0F9C611_9ZZZZ
MTYRDHKEKYLQHRRMSKHRGISWLFNYVTWWRKWCESEKWEQRGNHGKKYCMARFGDKGPYSYENTKIITCIQNQKEVRLSTEQKENLRLVNLGNKHCLGKKNALGYRHTAKARASMSAKRMGHKYNLGHKHTEETKAKMSKSQKGKVRSPETKAKLSAARRKWWKERRA